MRAVVQRVSRASVTIAERISGQIDKGVLVLVGFTHEDQDAAVDWVAEKITHLLIFPDDEGKMNRSVQDVGGGILVVSQFTLYGDVQRGRRPSFIDAARPEIAISLYERFIATLKGYGNDVATGEFGAMMDVELVNDGPVTLLIER
jgi:D-tyrosyl-tRNA(Tyr) deacylase